MRGGSGIRERRRHGRAKIHMEAILEGDRPEDAIKLTVLNFSAGGFFCKSTRPIEPMTLLGITFQFPPYAEHPPRTLDTTAVVVRCEKPAPGQKHYRMAACFPELTEDVKEHIEGYVSWYDLVYGGFDSTAEGR